MYPPQTRLRSCRINPSVSRSWGDTSRCLHLVPAVTPEAPALVIPLRLAGG